VHLGLGEVPDPAVHAALEQVHLRQDHLVVQPLQLRQQCVNQGQRGLVLPRLQLPASSQWTGRVGKDGAHRAMSRVSRLCLRKMRFSRCAHAMLSVSTEDWISWLSGIAPKKSSSVRTAAVSSRPWQ
jgi:hypothetical protein